MIVLRDLDSPGGPREVSFGRASVTVGFGAGVDLCLGDDGSRRCRLSADGEQARIESATPAAVQVSDGGRWAPVDESAQLRPGGYIAIDGRRVQLVSIREPSVMTSAPSEATVAAAAPSVFDETLTTLGATLDLTGRAEATLLTDVVDAPPPRPTRAAEPLVETRALTATLLIEPADDALFDDHRPRLCFVGGPFAGRVLPLGPAPVGIGSGPRADVRVPDGHLADVHFTCAPTPGGHRLVAHAPLGVTGIREQMALAAGRDLEPLRSGALIEAGETVVEYFAGPALDARPRFVLPGGVETERVITIGRAADCAVVLDDAVVDPIAAEVLFDGRIFTLVDRGEVGVYHGSTRVSERTLGDGDQMRIGPFVLAFGVDGRRCSVAVGFTLPARTPEPRPAQALADASPYATVLRRAVGDDDAGPAVHQARRARRAPVWRAPRDVMPSRFGRVGLAIGALLLGGWAWWAASDDGAVEPRPMSAPHASKAFARAAAEAGVEGCASCHASIEGPAPARCEGCHAAPPRDVHASITCLGCHLEHPAEPTPALVAEPRCAACHPSSGDGARHQTLTAARPHRTHDTTTTPLAGLSSDHLHAAHRAIEGACFACHPAGKAPGPVARVGCLDCHGGTSQLARPCVDCHGEHGALPAGPRVAVRAVEPPGGSGGGWLALVPLVAFVLPLLGLARRRGVPDDEVREAEDTPPVDGEWSRKQQIHITPDLCVACAACVETCPYHVLDLREVAFESKALGREARRLIAEVVDFDRCQQETFCEVECPTGALRRAFGALELVDAPAVDRHFETSLPGVYLAGAVSGVELVKNALNIGHRCVEHAVAAGDARAATPGVYDLAIIGLGPAGLAAAAAAEHHGLRHLVVEKGPGLAGMLTDNYPPDKPVQLNPVEVRNISRVWLPDAPEIEWRALRAAWVEHYAPTTAHRETRFEVTLTGLEQVDGGYRLTLGADTITARRVVIAIGVKSNHNKLGRDRHLPGETSAKVKRALIDPTPYRGARCAVIGCGNAGVECALALTAGGAAEVTLVNHRDAFQVGGRGGMTPENHDRLVHAMAQSGGRLRAWHATGTVAIHPDAVEFTHQTSAVEQTGPDAQSPLGRDASRLPNDHVFAMIGARPPLSWLASLGVELTRRPVDWFPEPTDALAEI